MSSNSIADYLPASGRWASRIAFLTIENMGDRYKRSKIGAALAILEPIGVVALFALTHSIMGGRAPYGQSLVLFYASGILPFYLFFHVSWRMRAWDFLRRIPGVSEFDMMLIHVLPEVW